jgi:hypothetical protein
MAADLGTALDSGSEGVHPAPMVEAPLHSPRWAAFFTACCVLVLALGVWLSFIFPSMLLDHAAVLCEQERAAAKAVPLPYGLSMGASACWRLIELQGKSSLTDRVRTFTQTSLPAVLLLGSVAGRLRARRATQALKDDPRAPVLYLRSFWSDRFDALGASKAGDTEETRAVSSLERIGPVLAIGKPGDKLPRLGAARLQVSHSQWQDVAVRLMRGARLIVFRVFMATPGFTRELSLARGEMPAEKVVLWFPLKFDAAGYAAIREVVRECLKVELPTNCPKGFVTFDSEWKALDAVRELPAEGPVLTSQPQVVPPQLTESMRHSTVRSADEGVASLAALLSRLDMTVVRPPPFRPYLVVWIGVIVWLVALLAVPGERWAWDLDGPFEHMPHLVKALIEGVSALLLALALAFYPYVNRPARRWLPSLVLSTVLALDGYWIWTRMVVDASSINAPSVSAPVSQPAFCRKLLECPALAQDGMA